MEDNSQLALIRGFLHHIQYGGESVQDYVDDIDKLLYNIECCESPDILQKAVDLVKGYVQTEAKLSVIRRERCWGLLAMATGSGKSKVPIDAIQNSSFSSGDKILIIVPTEKLRDTGWKEEFSKWGCTWAYERYVETTCYASLHNYTGNHYKFVIGDEFHNITEAKISFFQNNTISNFFALTATAPKSPEKLALLESIGLPTTYTLSLDVAVRLRLVAPFEMTIVEVDLDNQYAYIPGGNATNRFYQTEVKAYQYLDRVVESAPTEANIFKRVNFIKNLVSAKNASIFVLENLLPPDERTLIFCGSIDQAIELCPYRYFSKPTVSKKANKTKQEKAKRQLEAYQGEESLERFIAMEINRLSCVNRLNEGANIPMLNNILITFLTSVDKDLIQMVGRLIRYRIDHLGRVVIIVSKDTKAMIWLETAIAGFDKSKIRRINFTDLVNRKVTLFNQI